MSLQNTEFLSKSVSKKDPASPLSTTDEILYNSIWRFLAVREYVDAKHNLTAWGKVLVAAVVGLKGRSDLEAAAVIAVELLRLGSLTADISMFPTYNGAPMRGSCKFSTTLEDHIMRLTVPQPKINNTICWCHALLDLASCDTNPSASLAH
jgi:hypothetical protein